MSTKWFPKSVLALKNYSRQDFVADLIAGVTVGLVALPLAMAFAIASGMPPQAGLYCAVIAGFLISALGGSRVQIGGRQARLWWLWPELLRGTALTACSCAQELPACS